MRPKANERVRDESHLHPMKDLRPELVPTMGRPASYTCPECGGPIAEIKEGTLIRFRCQVGHAFSVHAMLVGRMKNTEACIFHLESNSMECARLADQMVEQAHKERLPAVARKFQEAGRVFREMARLFQATVLKLPDISLDSANARKGHRILRPTRMRRRGSAS